MKRFTLGLGVLSLVCGSAFAAAPEKMSLTQLDDVVAGSTRCDTHSSGGSNNVKQVGAGNINNSFNKNDVSIANGNKIQTGNTNVAVNTGRHGSASASFRN